jgi:hypothetical protein
LVRARSDEIASANSLDRAAIAERARRSTAIRPLIESWGHEDVIDRQL